MNNSKEEKQQRDGLPQWIKRTAAIVGILATVAAIFTGGYQVFLQVRKTAIDIEKERTKQHQADEGAEKARLNIKNTELEILKEKTKEKQAEKEKAQIELQQQETEGIRAEKEEQRKQDQLKEKEILQAISDVADKKEPTLGALLILSAFVSTYEHDNLYIYKHYEQILNALLMKVRNSDSTTEIEYIFKLFNKMMSFGWDSILFNEVVQLNRKAFSQFKESLIRLFWNEVEEIFDQSLEKKRDLSLYEIKDLLGDLDPIIRSISEEIRLIPSDFQELILYEACFDFAFSMERKITYYVKTKSKFFDMKDTAAIAHQKLVINALIVDKTKRFIGEFLRNRSYDIDLSETYLSGIKITRNLKNVSFKFDDAIVFDVSKYDPFSVFPVLANIRNYSGIMNQIFDGLEHRYLKVLAFYPEQKNNFLKKAIDQINTKLGETAKVDLASDQLNLKSRMSLYIEWQIYQSSLKEYFELRKLIL